MCKLLEVPRSLIYYYLKARKDCKNTTEAQEIKKHIVEIFRLSRNNYGTRKIKAGLSRLGFKVSRRRIARLMKENCLVSNYTVAQYKVHKTNCNEAKTPNVLDRSFNNRDKLEAVVSDLTYVRTDNKWSYICNIVDLHNRELLASVAGEKKDAKLISEAMLSIRYPLSEIKIFHSDRGSEYDNKLIDEILDAFEIDRSLSNKGNPYDNAVSESVNKIMKTEFIYQNKFASLEELQLALAEYVYWYNNFRLHGSLGYLTPVEYRKLSKGISVA